MRGLQKNLTGPPRSPVGLLLVLTALVMAAATGCGGGPTTPTSPTLPTTPPPPPPPTPAAYYDDAYWKEFAFNDYDCPSATCGEPIDQRILWRLPTTSPNVFILTTSMPANYVTQIEDIAPRAIAELTGVPYAGRVVTGDLDRQRSERGWITFEGGEQESGVAGKTKACEGLIPGDYLGQAKLGAEIGCIVLAFGGRIRANLNIDFLIAHELTHALGFWHTAVGESSQVEPPPNRQYTVQEKHHGNFAYTRERGETYADIALPANTRRVSGPSLVPPSPFAHGGVIVD